MRGVRSGHGGGERHRVCRLPRWDLLQRHRSDHLPPLSHGLCPQPDGGHHRLHLRRVRPRVLRRRGGLHRLHGLPLRHRPPLLRRLLGRTVRRLQPWVVRGSRWRRGVRPLPRRYVRPRRRGHGVLPLRAGHDSRGGRSVVHPVSRRLLCGQRNHVPALRCGQLQRRPRQQPVHAVPGGLVQWPVGRNLGCSVLRVSHWHVRRRCGQRILCGVPSRFCPQRDGRHERECLLVLPRRHVCGHHGERCLYSLLRWHRQLRRGRRRPRRLRLLRPRDVRGGGQRAVLAVPRRHIPRHQRRPEPRRLHQLQRRHRGAGRWQLLLCRMRPGTRGRRRGSAQLHALYCGLLRGLPH